MPNLEASQALARLLWQEHLEPHKNFTLFLEGGLGVGKTFFIREMLKFMGVAGEVSSPTYIFLNQYQHGTKSFAHFDFYRLPHPDEFFARGFLEIAEDDQTSKFVEWPGKLSPEALKTFSGKRFKLLLEHGIGAGMRKAKFFEDTK